MAASRDPTEHLDRSTLRALLSASQAVNNAGAPQEACQRVAEHAVAVLAAEAASVLRLDAVRKQLVFETVVDPVSAEQMTGVRFPSDEGIAGQVVRTRRPVRIDDVRDNQNFYPGIDKLTQQKTRNLMAVPLIHHGEVLGVIEVINRRDGSAFRQSDLELLELFANLVAGAAHRVLEVDALSHTNEALRESIPPAQFVGESPAFKAALELCSKVAPTDTTVLLTGETGTGKEMAARTICSLSGRADGPFVAVNCAALPASLVESELFGHEAGAFTGATTQRRGTFELAHRGTLLLDELGELELPLQAKLLRVIETGELTRVGGTTPIQTDVRIIAATNRDLRREVDAGRFREDLFYRVNLFPITLPPLRERAADLPLLIEHVIARVAPKLGVAQPAVGPRAMACLSAYAWPGNVRELRNVMERAVLLADDTIHPEHLPPEVAHSPTRTTDEQEQERSTLASQEARIVRKALEANDWNQSAAARQLGITRDILRSRIKRYQLRKP